MRRTSYLKHGQKQVLLTALVLVSVDGKHDGLEQRIDFGHGNQAAEMGNVSRF
jgi:hypothetical protein